MRLDDVAAVEKRHSSILLDPDLVAGVLGDNGEGCDVQAELARLGELACGGFERLDIVLHDISGLR
jgi:hypothetical protein